METKSSCAAWFSKWLLGITLPAYLLQSKFKWIHRRLSLILSLDSFNIHLPLPRSGNEYAHSWLMSSCGQGNKILSRVILEWVSSSWRWHWCWRLTTGANVSPLGDCGSQLQCNVVDTASWLRAWALVLQSVSVGAVALTKWRRRGGLHCKHLFLTVERLESPRPRFWQIWCLARALFLVFGWLPSCYVLTCWGEREKGFWSLPPLIRTLISSWAVYPHGLI